MDCDRLGCFEKESMTMDRGGFSKQLSHRFWVATITNPEKKKFFFSNEHPRPKGRGHVTSLTRFAARLLQQLSSDAAAANGASGGEATRRKD
ncbi:MAG: hypothetical protein AB4050_01320 [Synechococcus sp.]